MEFPFDTFTFTGNNTTLSNNEVVTDSPDELALKISSIFDDLSMYSQKENVEALRIILGHRSFFFGVMLDKKIRTYCHGNTLAAWANFYDSYQRDISLIHDAIANEYRQALANAETTDIDENMVTLFTEAMLELPCYVIRAIIDPIPSEKYKVILNSMKEKLELRDMNEWYSELDVEQLAIIIHVALYSDLADKSSCHRELEQFISKKPHLAKKVVGIYYDLHDYYTKMEINQPGLTGGLRWFIDTYNRTYLAKVYQPEVKVEEKPKSNKVTFVEIEPSNLANIPSEYLLDGENFSTERKVYCAVITYLLAFRDDVPTDPGLLAPIVKYFHPTNNDSLVKVVIDAFDANTGLLKGRELRSAFKTLMSWVENATNRTYKGPIDQFKAYMVNVIEKQ